MRVRLRYSKLGKVRFLGHRDVARAWERAIRRVRLPIAYSEGFSPRPKLHFGLALPTGHESVAEYLDVDLRQPVDIEPLPGLLSDALPAGIDVAAATALPAGTESLQSTVTSCDWLIHWARDLEPADIDRLHDEVTRLLAAPSLPVTIERKGRSQVADLRPAVVDMTMLDDARHQPELRVELSMAPRAFRPVELLGALTSPPADARVRRMAQWTTIDGRRCEPVPVLQASIPGGDPR